MRYKPEAGTPLDSINRDNGVANEIFIENSPEHNNYNTDLQRLKRLERTLKYLRGNPRE